MKILFIIYEKVLGSFQLWLIKQPLQLTALPKRNIVMYFYILYMCINTINTFIYNYLFQPTEMMEFFYQLATNNMTVFKEIWKYKNVKKKNNKNEARKQVLF